MAENRAMTTLPRWRCHRVVRAAEILRIVPRGGVDGAWRLWLRVANGGTNELEMDVPAFVFSGRGRDNARAGDYLVHYETGAQGWLSKHAFESGYHREEEAPN